MDYDRQQVTCPQGQVSQGWHGPYPTSSPTAAPLIVARFTKSQCQPCPARTQCTTSRESTRTVGFPPRELRDLQLRVRTEQQTPEWKTRYAVRSGVEGTVNEFAHGYGMRRCRYRGQGKAHIQHCERSRYSSAGTSRNGPGTSWSRRRRPHAGTGAAARFPRTPGFSGRSIAADRKGWSGRSRVGECPARSAAEGALEGTVQPQT
ncbi:transposase [Streptomyces sp. NPDC048723]|uniref:transposase n=1 Tax=Streptomyces sp. NPDC048723 TaxID=3365589 RepID=UPI0037157D7E